jgi:8-oxo-dGTP diphosphatase
MIKKVPEKLFQKIKENIPLSCVDIILVKNNEFLLVKRSISPYKNKWCLPGGIIKKNQKIIQRLQQVGKEELGIKVDIIKSLGVYEKIYQDRHDISHCYVATSSKQELKLDFQAKSAKFFTKIPNNTSNFHALMLRDAGFL